AVTGHGDGLRRGIDDGRRGEAGGSAVARVGERLGAARHLQAQSQDAAGQGGQRRGELGGVGVEDDDVVGGGGAAGQAADGRAAGGHRVGDGLASVEAVVRDGDGAAAAGDRRAGEAHGVDAAGLVVDDEVGGAVEQAVEVGAVGVVGDRV